MKKLKTIGKGLIPFLIISFCFIILGLFAFKAGKEFQANTHTDWKQQESSVAVDKRGNFVIAWASEGQDGADYGIFAQRFNKRGKALGSEFQVNTYTDYSQYAPAVAMDKKGNFVITWWSKVFDGFFMTIAEIRAQRFNKQGKALGSEFLVSNYNKHQYSPAIAMNEKGNFVIAWNSDGQDGSFDGIFAQRFNKQGKALGPIFQVNTYTLYRQSFPAIAMNKKGNFVITWKSEAQDGSDYGIFAQMFNPQGIPIGPEFQVNTNTIGGQHIPVIGMDDKGNIVIAWVSWKQDGQGKDGIFAQRFNPQGKALGSEFQVNTSTDNYLDYPAIAMDVKGNFVIAWGIYNLDSSAMGIFAQRFNPQGKPIGSEFQVNTYTYKSQTEPAIAMDKRGNFVITWESDGQDGSELGIFGKVFKK